MECFSTILSLLESNKTESNQPEAWTSCVSTTQSLLQLCPRFVALSSEITPLREEVANVREIIKSNSSINSMVKEYEELNEKNQREREERIIHENDVSAIEDRLKKLQNKVAPLANEIAIYEEELKGLEKQNEELDLVVKNNSEELNSLNLALDDLTTNYAKMSLEEEQITRRLLNLKTKEVELINDINDFPTSDTNTTKYNSPLPKRMKRNDDNDDDDDDELNDNSFFTGLKIGKSSQRHNGKITCIGFANTKTFLATGGEDSSVNIVDYTNKTGSGIRLKEIQQGSIMATKFSPFDNFLCVASYDSTVKLYKVPSFSLSVNITENRECVSDVCFASDSKFVTCCRDNTIKLYDINKTSSISSFTSTSIPYSISILQGETTFVTAHHDGKIRLWDFRTHSPPIELNAHKSQIIQVIGTRNSSRLIALSTDKTISVSDFRAKAVAGRINIQASGLPSDKMQMSVMDNFVYIGSNNGDIYEYDLQTYKLKSNMKAHHAPVLCVSIKPQSRIMASGDKTGIIKLWDK